MTIGGRNARALEARLATRPAALQAARKAMVVTCSAIIDETRWALDPDEDRTDNAYWADRALERAHELLDLAHAFRAALRASPVEGDDDDAVW